MDDVISVSSDSDVTDDSDVEVIGSFSNVMPKAEPLPVTAARAYADAVNVSALCVDLTDPRWTLPELKSHRRQNVTVFTVDNLAETKVANETIQERTNPNQSSNKEDSSGDPPVFALQRDCDSFKTNQRSLDCQTQYQKQIHEAYYCTAIVKLRRLPFLETQVAKLKIPQCSVYLNKDCTEMSMDLRQLDNNSEAPECISNSVTTAANCCHMDHSLDESPPKVAESLIKQKEQENSDEFPSTQLNAKVSQHLHSSANSPCSDKRGFVTTSKDCSTHEKRDDFCSSMLIPSPSSLDKAQGSLQREVPCSILKQLELDKAGSRQSYHSPNLSEPSHLNSLSHPVPVADNFMSQLKPTPAAEQTPTENTSEWQDSDNADKASNSFSCRSITNELPLSVSNEDKDGSGPGTNIVDLVIDSPVDSSVFFLWQDGSAAEEENRFDMDFREASREDRQSVCPVMFRKIMSGQAQALLDDEEKHFGNPEVLCPQSLSLVYSTIDESYPEGTLQLLSDLLQPGYYPPRDITSHLLRGILLDPQSPHHLCVWAFNLLMRTQRHHMADKTTVPWDWDLLTSVMANQDHTKRHPCEVVRMVLDYAVQTLEDDFQAKRSTYALHHSIAKATLSCDQHFPRIREVIKWLFSAITKSTEHEERQEQIRMVSILQRMLSLALEVDRSPALNTAKLSQELFHMLISDVPLRAHRMLLLESLQSKLLRCKLLEHLLDYACPLKIPLPMSLSLLLHFLKYCTLAPDPSDGTDRWQKWEELVHLLWMLLLSYNKAMTGYLCNSVSEQKGRVGNLVYKADDMVSKSAIHEAVEAFLLRSQVDLGQALPLHVEESLTYLQDHLLDVCQC